MSGPNDTPLTPMETLNRRDLTSKCGARAGNLAYLAVQPRGRLRLVDMTAGDAEIDRQAELARIAALAAEFELCAKMPMPELWDRWRGVIATSLDPALRMFDGDPPASPGFAS